MPEAWPILNRPDPGVRVHSWYHRGTLGSDRPADESRITLADHVSDALAVLTTAEIGPVVVMGWSAGVTVACELAIRFPELVSGLLLVAGTPGDVFGGMFGIRSVPVATRRALAGATGRLAGPVGPLLNLLLHHVPVNELTAMLVRHSGLIRPSSDNADVVLAGQRFLTHDWGWYLRLAMALAGEPARRLVDIHCPVTLLTGRYDPLAEPRPAIQAMAALPQTRSRVLPTSHFLPLEAPDDLADELRLLIERADAVRAARYWQAGAVTSGGEVTGPAGTHPTLTPAPLR